MALRPVKAVVTVAKYAWKFGVFLYEAVDELLVEKRQEEARVAAAHREMSRRYTEASHSAGPASRKP